MENYSVLKMLVLDEILDMRPSFEMSRELGFNFDKYKRWMKSEKILRWNEFVEICEKFNLNLAGAIEMLKLPIEDAVVSEKLFTHLKESTFLKTNQEISDYLNCHVSVVKRYSIGNTIPDVETIFKLISFKSNHLSMFVSRLFSDEIKNPFLKKWVDTDSSSARFESQFPISSMISAALFLDGYKKRNIRTAEWLSAVLNLELSNVHEALKQMIDSHIIKVVADDVFVPEHITTNLDGVTIQEIIPFIQYLNRTVVEKLERKKRPEFKSSAAQSALEYRVFPASLESIDKINLILNKAHTEILKVLEEDECPKIEVRTILLQHFSLTK
ncbi:MAG: hypothetical protein H7177_00460 [Rhizobacter sp.]|nr:hypothetical protein [Bacteriovorax sp.]